ncbi:ABC transporter permease [Emticicia sp. SJ17W-69]|uniref:ABC transporter permease n=1 Tax=Emticicia sp. SJ17W-69 TaxID=3421657 RepID=UPI003EBC55F8
MLKNYFKIAFRNLLKNKVYSGINIVGLAMGVAAAVLLFALIHYELSFDNFHQKADRTYRVVREVTTNDGNVDYTSGAPLAMVDALKQEIPQFEKIVPVCGTLEPQITVLGKDPNSNTNSSKYTEDNQGICAGPEFFEVFDFKWLIGSPKVLTEPNVVVLSKKYAEKYFGKYETAVGQYLKYNNNTVIKVVGILDDIPLNTDLPANIVFSYASKRSNAENFGFGQFDNWGSTSSMDNIFVVLPEKYTEQQANKQLFFFTQKHWDAKKDNDKKKHTLSAISNMHYDDRYSNYNDRTISKKKIMGIALVGLLIIFMACINFINISTAIASKRAKEVGVRKTLGSANAQLIKQFMTETMILVAFAIGIGLLIARLSLPLLSSMFDYPLAAKPFAEPMLWVFVISIFIIINVLSGIYPSLVLSSFTPLDAFRQKVKVGWTKGLSLRQGLIVFQFSIAIIMMLGTLVNFEQMRFIDNMETGYKKEGVFTFSTDTEYKSRFQTFKEKLKQIPEVEAVSLSNDEPSSQNNWQANFSYDNSPKDADFNVNMKFADGDYFETYGIKVIAGKPYLATDTLRKLVVNETLLRKLGVKNPETAIGKMIRVGGWEPYPIVAVIKDFQVGSAKDEIAPILTTIAPKFYWRGGIKLSSSNLTGTVAKIEKVYNEVFPEVVFSGTFYEDKLKEFYKAEQQLGLLYRIASLLAIFISCLGIFGLATFVAEQRIKEIGIRKVLGATMVNITGLLSKDFVKLVLISMVIAFPVAYYFMSEWLQDFKFRTDIQWWYFVLVGLLAIVITLISVSYQAIKAALMNPVKSLKTE